MKRGGCISSTTQKTEKWEKINRNKGDRQNERSASTVVDANREQKGDPTKRNAKTTTHQQECSSTSFRNGTTPWQPLCFWTESKTRRQDFFLQVAPEYYTLNFNITWLYATMLKFRYIEDRRLKCSYDYNSRNSSVVEQPTADRQVTGSNPVFCFLLLWHSQGFFFARVEVSPWCSEVFFFLVERHRKKQLIIFFEWFFGWSRATFFFISLISKRAGAVCLQ